MTNVFRLQKLNFKVEYLGRIKSTEIPPYKTIEYLIEVSKNLFYPITSKIKILYNQSDIIPYSKYILGDFFKLKNQINLKIVSQNYTKPQSNYLNNKKFNINNNLNFICPCGKDTIKFYCRDCKMFICEFCKYNSIHSNHRTLKIDINNLIDSIKLYAKTLANEVLINIQKTQNYSEKLEKEEYNINNRNEVIKEKLNKLLDNYNEIISKLKIKNIEKVIEKYKLESNITNDEIEEILEKIYKKFTKTRREMNSDEFKQYFNEISLKEDILNKQSVDLMAIKVKYEFTEKMRLIYDKIELIIEKTFNGDNVLNLNSQTNYLYSLILKNEENKNIIKDKVEENEDNSSEKNEVHEKDDLDYPDSQNLEVTD
jgi:hypothetical protein